jgi:hypothetical protein
MYVFRCTRCREEIEALQAFDDPAPKHCGETTNRVPTTASFGFRTLGGNIARFSPSHGPVMKGNKRPATIGNGHGLGGRKGRTPPKLGRKSYA